jgi:3-deoxy-manno-octulosonate cytidylyltransferase (CMP-KDO synthetase)
MNKILAIIPARYESSRLKGKPLKEIKGKSMIMWVNDAVVSSNLFDEVYVATDDKRIFDEVEKKGGKCLMTSNDLRNGTERVEQALSLLEKQGKEFSYVVNIQGDEPLIKKQQIKDVIDGFDEKGLVDIVTLKKKIEIKDDVEDRNVVKVVVDKKGDALYFSRSIIPCNRDKTIEELMKDNAYYKHIGIYGYKAKVLHQIIKLEESTLEKIEKLEQLRWMENGYKIKVQETFLDTIGVDTQQDLDNIIKLIR